MRKAFKYFKFCWNYFYGYRRYVITIYLIDIVVLIASVITPLLSSQLITWITISDTVRALYMVGIIVIIQTIMIFLRHFLFRLDRFVSRNVSVQVKTRFLNELLDIEPKRLGNYNDGKIYSLLERDSNSIVSYVFTILDSILNFVTVIAIGIIILFLCYPLALVIFLTYPIMLVSNIFFGKKLKSRQTILLKETDEYNSFVKNIINNFDDVKSLSGNIKIKEKYLNTNEAIKLRYFQMDMLQRWNQNCSNIIGLINYIFFNVIGILLVVAGKLILGDFIAFNSYSTSFTSSLNSIVSLNAILQPTYVTIDRLSDLEQTYNNYLLDEKKKKSAFDSCDIVLHGLSLNLSGRIIFKDINVKLHEGEILRICGKNGCGKTSLFRILKKELNYNGTIFIGKNDYNNVSYKLVQSEIIFLRQNPSLLHISLYDNITLFDANKELEESKVVEACKKTLLWDDIQTLPNGLYTIIDDNMKLSAGQIQKIQLSRAILSNAKIVLCDEIFANLDDEATNIAVNILSELHSEGRTILYVSHQNNIVSGQVHELDLEKMRIL